MLMEYNKIQLKYIKIINLNLNNLIIVIQIILLGYQQLQMGHMEEVLNTQQDGLIQVQLVMMVMLSG